GEVLTVEVDGSSGDLTGRIEKPNHRRRGHGLARSALAHHSQRLASTEVEVDAADRLHDAPRDGKIDSQTAYGEEGCFFGFQRGSWSRGRTKATQSACHLSGTESGGQSVADEVDAQHRQDDGQPGKDRQPG